MYVCSQDPKSERVSNLIALGSFDCTLTVWNTDMSTPLLVVNKVFQVRPMLFKLLIRLSKTNGRRWKSLQYQAYTSSAEAQSAACSGANTQAPIEG